MDEKFKINVCSEVGEIEGVILHSPGREVESMTPENAERALYSDLLNLSVAGKEYDQFNKVLSRLTQTFQIKDLLLDILGDERVKIDLVTRICKNESVNMLADFLLKESNEDLCRQLIEGVVMRKDTLTKFLSKERYVLRPLHNFFFTRDASTTVFDKVFICKMAGKVREREAMIMEAIFQNHPVLKTQTINPLNSDLYNSKTTIEGGDILIAREDVILIGDSARTSSHGIDCLIQDMKRQKGKKHIIVQGLPYEPESFIHLDMVFTLLDSNKCMVYKPLILESNRYLTIHICIDNGKVTIKESDNLLVCLKKLGIDLEPVFCGGIKDSYNQEREQWHSGANFFAVGPGKVIGYGRNVHTIEEMNSHGFEIIQANDILSDNVDLSCYEKYVITIDGAELARGGGGCRCMTMPIRRKALS